MAFIKDKDATLGSFFGVVDQDVQMSVLALAGFLLVYVITVLMAFNQKNALRRRINELSAELGK